MTCTCSFPSISSLLMGMEIANTLAYLNSLFENSPEAIVLLDSHNRVIRTNPEFYRLFGYTEDEIRGLHIDTLIAGEKEYQEAALNSQRAEKGEHLNTESIRRCKDGTPVEVSILGAPIEVEGEIVGIFGIYRDISRRKKVERELSLSEHKYRELFENAPIGIFQSSSEGNFLTVNKTIADILGFDDPQSLISYYQDLSHQLYYSPERRSELISLLITQGEVKNFEIEARGKDGSVVWLSLNARISYWVSEENFVIDGFISDMTELKHTEKDLHTSLREKDVLLQEVHHRVKNNMQIISSMLNLEAMNKKNSRSRELLNVVQNRIQSMALVHEKLYRSDKIELIDLSEYTRDLCMQILDVVSEDFRPDVEFRLDPVFSGIDFCVPYGLIVNELVMNDYKHAFTHIPVPKITLELDKGVREIVLRVRDNGIGLPDNFEIDDSPTLGMKLIHLLILQLKGDFSYSNSEGTEWRIVFPDETVWNEHPM